MNTKERAEGRLDSHSLQDTQIIHTFAMEIFSGNKRHVDEENGGCV